MKLRAICDDCHTIQTLIESDGRNKLRFADHGCRSATIPKTPNKGERQVAKGVAPVAARWSSAKRTVCAQGHGHASMGEAGVCDRLTREYAADKLHRLVQQPRLALLRLAEDNGRLKYITIDFGVMHRNDAYPGLVRLVECKFTGRVSRDWPARKRAVELSWGVTVEEVSK